MSVHDSHWLRMDDERRITGCQCGFMADENDCGYGDSVLKHIVDEALTFPQDETWRRAPAPWSRYLVSTLGRVRSGNRLLAGATTKGYTQYTLHTNNDERRTVKAHTIVAATFLGPRPEGLLIRHLDGRRDNNMPGNLAYGTYAENFDDMFTHGTSVNGAAADECRSGHAFTPENTRITKRGDRLRRRCLTCDRRYKAVAAARKK